MIKNLELVMQES